MEFLHSNGGSRHKIGQMTYNRRYVLLCWCWTETVLENYHQKSTVWTLSILMSAVNIE